MSNLPLPKPARLGPPGLYILPDAVGCPGPVADQVRALTQLHFVLEDGTEFLLPISDYSLKRLYTDLRGLFDEGGGAVC
jgi:hypothetical protein